MGVLSEERQENLSVEEGREYMSPRGHLESPRGQGEQQQRFCYGGPVEQKWRQAA